MTLWIILTIMTSATAVWLSAPFIRRFDQPQVKSAADIEVYRDQLEEVESEHQQGLIDDIQAEAARLEIKKRALAADRTGQRVMPSLSLGERNFAVICVAGIVVLGAVGLYAVTGNPGLSVTRGPAPQASASFTRDSSTMAGPVAALQTFVSENRPQPQVELPPVDEMIRRLAARLAQNPKDPQGWRTLGWSYSSVGRFSDASEAYAKAIELNPNDVEIRSARIDALVRSADGVVTTDAKSAIEDALKISPGNAHARFFRGIEQEQQGDRTAALAEWREVLGDVDPNESWVPELRRKISELEGTQGADPAARTTGAAKPAVTGGSPETSTVPGGSPMAPAAEKGPSPQDVKAADAMTPVDRSAMIRGMVDRLANRLETSPRDADGWIKLIQSRMVLGETELAKQALAHGVEVFSDDTQQRDRIVAAAQKLGLGQQ